MVSDCFDFRNRIACLCRLAFAEAEVDHACRYENSRSYHQEVDLAMSDSRQRYSSLGSTYLVKDVKEGSVTVEACRFSRIRL